MLIKKVLVALVFAMGLIACSVQAGGDAAKGAELASSEGCADCHGDEGMGDEDFPKLAELEATEHAKKLAGFKDSDSEMADYVADLSEQDIHDLAAYYAMLGK